MRFSTSQYALRLTCGLGLLVIPAVQQKLCAWPAARTSSVREPAAPPTAPSSNETPKKEPKTPLTLAALIPDVAPPRWPNHTHLWEIQRARPLPVSTWTPGIPDDQHGPDDSQNACALIGADLTRVPLSAPNPAGARTCSWLARLKACLLHSTIQRTGPPTA